LDRWRDIIESLPDALIVLSSDLEPVIANQAAETILRVSPVSSGLLRDIFRQNDWLSRMAGDCLKNGQNLGVPETELHVGPRSIVVGAEVAPLLDEHGRTDCAIIVLRDLSHQKSAEHAASSGESNLRLSPAGLAHEVKNPLTGIKGAAELLASMFPDQPRAQQYCGVILDGVNRIAALVEQVLAVSAPQRLARDSVNIHQVLHAALRLSGLFPEAPAGVTVEQVFDPSIPEVVGDAAALERAFLNLITNAREAIGARGTIRLLTRMETQFRMSAEGRARQFLRVEISDSGPGMTEAEMSQLFTPFFTTKPTGTGLGLVLSQRIIALHGGRLWAERGGVGRAPKRGEPPGGMTFKVTLPVKRAGDPDRQS